MNHEHTDQSELPNSPRPQPNHHSRSHLGKNHQNKSLWGVISSIILFILFTAIIAIMLTAFIVQSYQVDGESMETNLQNHDRLIVDKLPRTWSRITQHQYLPKRGNIVIFNQAGLTGTIEQKQLIKRVIGLPGDKVSISNGKVSVYNSAHPEGFNPDKEGKYTIVAPYTSGDRSWSVESDEIFVLGDNRGNSEDSRYFGPVKTNAIVGKLVLRIYPFNMTRSF